MDSKEKIMLQKEQETLLIPLFAKANGGVIFTDKKAAEILAGIDYPFSELNIPQKTSVTLLLRAAKLDEYTQDFILCNPDGLILHLGCGLDSRCVRVDRANTFWVDLDMPDVIEIRRKFYSENEKYQLIASSVTDLSWLDKITQPQKPVLIIAEGLLMYLHEENVRELFLALIQKFSSACEIIFDAFSKYTVDRIKNHPSIKKTGAAIHWGIDDPHLIEQWDEGIIFKEEWFFSQSPLVSHLSPMYRFMFRLTDKIEIARRAQRILIYDLNQNH